MPTISTTPRSTVLQADADAVYAFLTDIAFLPEWYPDIAAAGDASSPEPKPGSTFVEHRRIAPGASLPFTLTVTAADPGERFHVHSSVRGLGRIEGRYELEVIDADRTCVTVDHRIVVTRRLLVPAAMALRTVLERGNRAQLRAMPIGLARWRGDLVR